MTMIIKSDPDKCVASGACVFTAPRVFAQDDDGIVVTLVPEPGPELAAEALAGVRACPAAAIWSEG
jgi:ferredoxin